MNKMRQIPAMERGLHILRVLCKLGPLNASNKDKSRGHNCKEPGEKNSERLVPRARSTVCPGTLSLPLIPHGFSLSAYFPPTWNRVFPSISHHLLLSELLLPQRVCSPATPGRPGPFQHPHISSDAVFQLRLPLPFPSSFPK